MHSSLSPPNRTNEGVTQEEPGRGALNRRQYPTDAATVRNSLGAAEGSAERGHRVVARLIAAHSKASRGNALDPRSEYREEGSIKYVEPEASFEQEPPEDRRNEFVMQRRLAHAAFERKQLANVVHAIFFINFPILALVFFAGAGLHINGPGDVLTTAARMAALVGTYLLLVQLLLVGRLPWLDRLYGIDRLTRWHKVNGHISLNLLIFHAVCVVVGRAWSQNMPVGTMMVAILDYRFMVPAVLGLVLMIAAVVTSIRSAKRKVPHETWHMMHMWTYAGVFMSFGHELYGPDFTNQPLAQGYLWFLYGATFGLILGFRAILPIIRTFRHQLRVAGVVKESDNVVSVYMTGFHLERLQAKPGQFMYWRFITRDLWRQWHPYSLSVAPNSKYLRITIKNLGDASEKMRYLRRGTWVAFQGPYGAFTPEVKTRQKSLLLAAGVGVAPVRSLLEAMPSGDRDITVIYRVSQKNDAILLGELDELASAKGAELFVISGQRKEYHKRRQPLSPEHLISVVPDIRSRDVFMCGSPGIMRNTLRALEILDVPKKQIHYESF